MNAPMASLPVVIFQFALTPYEDWQQLAWTGALLITVTVLAAQHHCPLSHREKVMNVASTDATAGRSPRRRQHASIGTTGLAEKDLDPQSRVLLWRDLRALKSINLSLYANKVTAFIGPSGCGKSTLLRVLNRMYDLYPDQRATGEVLFDGENLLDASQDLNLLRARIGMVFQKPTPFPMSIYDNIAFGIRALREAAARRGRRPRRARRCAARRCGTRSRTSSTPSGLSLSGGQQQRLCIARTVAVKPEVILFDEPCSALDPISTAKIEELIDELKPDYTIVIVTHNMQQAARVSDYTAFMYLGELIEFDETERSSRPPGQADPGLHHRAASADRRGRSNMATEHILKRYDEELRPAQRHDQRDGRPHREPVRQGAGRGARRATPRPPRR